MKRREILVAMAALAVPGAARAAPAADIQERRLQNRLELWANYSGRTRNLVARYTLVRRSSLLDAPLQTTGTLVFLAPDRLVLRDDGMTGSTTDVTGGLITIRPLQPGAAALEIQASRRPAVEWLRERLLRAFAPTDGASLIEGCRTHVPRGRGYNLDLMPARGSSVRKVVRSVTLTLDPVAGAVTRIHISEAQGDVVELSLTDHRQNVDEAGLAQALGEQTAPPTPPPGALAPEP